MPMDLEQTSKIIDDLIGKIVKEVTDPSRDDNDLTFTFNTNTLEPYKKGIEDAYKNPPFIKMFDKLQSVKNHCLYWFEVRDTDKRDRLMGLLNAYRETKDTNDTYKTVPAKALKGNDCSDSTIIYVGIRRGKGEGSRQKKSNIANRINQHLGYYKTNATQGLQLSCYASNEDIEMKLKVFEFKNLKNDYLNLIEKAVARHFNPHCGRH